MRKAFSGLAVVLLLVVVAQFFLAGVGAFDTAPNDESFAPHRAVGYLLLLVAIVLTILAAVARMPGRLVGTTGLVAGLMLLQPVIATIAGAFDDGGRSSTAGTIIFGLHAVNALVIAAVLMRVMRQVRELSAEPVS